MQDSRSRRETPSEEGRAFLIKFLKGPREGEVVPLEGRRITIGRRSDNTIVVADQNISSVHAEITFESGVPVIRDLGSTNGVLVDQRRVDEVVLSEGDEVSLGQTQFVLLGQEAVLQAQEEGAGAPEVGIPAAAGAVDSTEAPPVGAGPAGGTSEEGDQIEEVRVIHDIRPGRRGLGSLLFLLVLVVALGAAGYYYFFRSAEKSGGRTVEAAKGNLAGLGWSFEHAVDQDGAAADPWDLEGLSPARFSRVFDKARSGATSLKSVFADGSYAVARSADRIRVSARRTYKVSLWAALQGDVVVSLKARFYGSADRGAAGSGERVPLASPVDVGFSHIDDGAYHAIEGLIAPPAGASEMEISIVAAGRGTAHIDDLEVFEDASAAEPETFQTGAMALRRMHGHIEVLRSDRLLLRGGRIQVVRDAEEGEVEFLNSLASGFDRGKGYLFAGSGAPLLEVSHSLTESADHFAAGLKIDGTDAAGCRELLYCFDLEPKYAEAGVGLFLTDDYVTISEPFPPMSAEGIIFGSQHERVRVGFKKEMRVSGAALEHGGLTIRCHIKPLVSIEESFQIKCDFTEDYKDAQGLVKEATRAEENRDLGEALRLIARIEHSYRFIDSVFNQAAVIKARIMKEKKGFLDEINESLKSAAFLQNPELFDNLEARCVDRLRLIPDDVDLNAALERVRDQSRELRQTIDNERAEKYYNIANNLHAAGNRTETLSLILAFMEERFPDSEWTLKAQELGQE